MVGMRLLTSSLLGAHWHWQERLFLIVVALVGAVVFSYCMGTISSLLTEVDTVRLHGCESLFPWHLDISYNRLKVSKTDVPD